METTVKCWRCNNEAGALWYTRFGDGPSDSDPLYQNVCVSCLQTTPGHDPACRWCHRSDFETYSEAHRCDCPEGKVAAAWTAAGLSFTRGDVLSYRYTTTAQQMYEEQRRDIDRNIAKEWFDATTSGVSTPIVEPSKATFQKRIQALFDQLAPKPPEEHKATFYKYESPYVRCAKCDALTTKDETVIIRGSHVLEFDKRWCRSCCTAQMKLPKPTAAERFFAETTYPKPITTDFSKDPSEQGPGIARLEPLKREKPATLDLASLADLLADDE